MPIQPNAAIQETPYGGQISSKRKYPWSFMGTLWSNTSRNQAIDSFTKLIPNEFLIDAHHQSVPLEL